MPTRSEAGAEPAGRASRDGDRRQTTDLLELGLTPITGRDWLACFGLALLALMRFAPSLFSTLPLIDEAVYLESFQRVALGLSPYGAEGFFYPPSFAALGARVTSFFPGSAMLALLRAFNLAGAVWLTWQSVRLTRLPFAVMMSVAGVVVVAVPGFALGLETGNLSPLACAMIVAGMLYWRSAPVICGGLLGASLALKPMAAVAIPLLICHRSVFAGSRWRLITASSLAGILFALLPGRAFLADYLALGELLPIERYPLIRTVSLHRLLFNLGFRTERFWLFVALVVVFLIVGRLRGWNRTELCCLGISAVTLSWPAHWSHTLLVTMPLQALAIGAAFSISGREGRGFRPLHLLGVLACCTSFHFSEGVGGMQPGPSLRVALANLPVLISVVALTLWVVSRAERPAAVPAVVGPER